MRRWSASWRPRTPTTYARSPTRSWTRPQFLWITRGISIWGRPAALARFESLYQGTWRLEPTLAELKVTLLAQGVAQIHVPILFTIGPPGQEPQKTRFLMNQVLVRTGTGWKVASILPIPAATQ